MKESEVFSGVDVIEIQEQDEEQDAYHRRVRSLVQWTHESCCSKFFAHGRPSYNLALQIVTHDVSASASETFGVQLGKSAEELFLLQSHYYMPRRSS